MSDQRPIRKTQARNATRQRARIAEQRKNTIKKLIPIGTVFVVVVFLLFVGLAIFKPTATPEIQGTTGPRLQVDRETIDLGNRIFNQPVRALFNVKNVGDGTLKLETPRVANVLEGY